MENRASIGTSTKQSRLQEDTRVSSTPCWKATKMKSKFSIPVILG